MLVIDTHINNTHIICIIYVYVVALKVLKDGHSHDIHTCTSLQNAMCSFDAQCGHTVKVMSAITKL